MEEEAGVPEGKKSKERLFWKRVDPWESRGGRDGSRGLQVLGALDGLGSWRLGWAPCTPPGACAGPAGVPPLGGGLE